MVEYSLLKLGHISHTGGRSPILSLTEVTEEVYKKRSTHIYTYIHTYTHAYIHTHRVQHVLKRISVQKFFFNAKYYKFLSGYNIPI